MAQILVQFNACVLTCFFVFFWWLLLCWMRSLVKLSVGGCQLVFHFLEGTKAHYNQQIDKQIKATRTPCFLPSEGKKNPWSTAALNGLAPRPHLPNGIKTNTLNPFLFFGGWGDGEMLNMSNRVIFWFNLMEWKIQKSITKGDFFAVSEHEEASIFFNLFSSVIILCTQFNIIVQSFPQINKTKEKSRSVTWKLLRCAAQKTTVNHKH